jgi:rSAM/selenodomain-associated transferase 2
MLRITSLHRPRRLQHESQGGRGASGDGFAIVVPTLEEAATIVETIAHLRAFPEVSEIVIVDGGSRDGTAARARTAGALVLEARRGRGAQMNVGARATTAPTLVFLHADCRLPPGAFDAMQRVLHGGCDAGVFGIRYDSRHPLLRLVGALSCLETRLTQFGEAALFVRRERFDEVGGFPEWPLFEDVDILSRLRRAGGVGRARGRVLTSARRYESCGILRQQLHNGLLLLLYHLGVSPERLSRRYFEVRWPPSAAAERGTHAEEPRGILGGEGEFLGSRGHLSSGADPERP